MRNDALAFVAGALSAAAFAVAIVSSQPTVEVGPQTLPREALHSLEAAKASGPSHRPAAAPHAEENAPSTTPHALLPWLEQMKLRQEGMTSKHIALR